MTYSSNEAVSIALQIKALSHTKTLSVWISWWHHQVVIFADLVNGDRINQARIRASNYLRTFSDAQFV